MPWSTQRATRTCLLTDKAWRLSGETSTFDDFDTTGGTVGVNEDGQLLDRFDIGVDFIPIIHTPNTPSTGDHFGRSSITPVAQLFDDIADTDTDIMQAAALAGGPVIGASGVNIRDITIRPGAVIPTGESGRLDVLDMSSGLKAVTDLLDVILDRLSVNSQVPAVVMGRISGEDVPSGVALSLSFAPFEQLVSVLRLTRHVAYGLLPKMAMRLTQINDPAQIPAGSTPKFSVTFQTTIPTDIAATVTNVVSLLQANGLSRATALRVLIESGFPIDDAEAELARIAAEDAEGAAAIVEATGSFEAGADYLGVTLDIEGGPDPTTGPPGDGLPGPLGG